LSSGAILAAIPRCIAESAVCNQNLHCARHSLPMPISQLDSPRVSEATAPFSSQHSNEVGRPSLRSRRTPLDRQTATLSVLIPVYNERATIEVILDSVHANPVRKEIIVVNDASTDGSGQILDRLLEEGKIDRLFHQPVNRGKGAAIRKALSMSTGDIVIVQDADLEYDPADWPALLEPILDGRADACFGSRFLGGPHRVLYFWHSLGNKLLTTLSNMMTNLNLTDMETCYKAIRGDVARMLLPRLTANRFGFEPEITARLAGSGARIYEVPVSYAGRTYAEGKKINWKDGVAALWHIVRFSR
jgi:glycosyltransferase involved in cell wall biosynthesis